MEKIYAGKIPLGKESIPHYVDSWTKDIQWIDNFIFYAEVEITGHARGRSAAYFQAIIGHPFTGNEEIKGKKVAIFITDMVDIIRNGQIYLGRTTGYWTFCKRGMNYGLRRVVPELIKES